MMLLILRAKASAPLANVDNMHSGSHDTQVIDCQLQLKNSTMRQE